MADNNYRAYRSRDPIAREDVELTPGDLGDNPLADLARLIGQRERVSEFDRSVHDDGSVQTLEQPAADQDWAEDERYAETDQPQHYAEESYAQPRLPDYPPEHGHQQYEDTRAPAPAPRYAEPADGYADARGHQQAYEPQAHEPRYQDDEQSYEEQYGDDPHDETRSYAPRYREEDEPSRTLARQAPGLAPQAHEQYDEQWDEQSDAADEYDDDTGTKRRNGLAIVLALLGLVLIGAAGAYAYRAMFGGAILVPSLPPIIKPADGPSKIVPTPTAPSGASNAAVGGNPSAPAQLVPREEQPVPVQPPPAPPRVLSTIPVAPAPSAPPAAGAPGASVFGSPPAAPAQTPGGAKVTAPAQTQGTPEPKKIHTVPIHPDQMGDAPAAAPTPVAPAPTPGPRSRAEPAPRSAPPPRGGNAPLSLVPGSQSAAPAVEAPRTRVARTEPAPAAPAPTAPAATAPAPSPSTGGYAVQVSSQRSEAEAQAAFRELQGKFPSQLGSRQPIIHRADLGDKGTYYRAMVGPFSSAESAASLCSSLKAAGGSCIVQKN
jgi:SPOR domain